MLTDDTEELLRCNRVMLAEKIKPNAGFWNHLRQENVLMDGDEKKIKVCRKLRIRKIKCTEPRTQKIFNPL